MEKFKKKFKSVRFRLFSVLCAVIVFLVLCLILINSVVLKNFYIYSKTNTVKKLYGKINNYYNSPNLFLNSRLSNTSCGVPSFITSLSSNITLSAYWFANSKSCDTKIIDISYSAFSLFNIW